MVRCLDSARSLVWGGLSLKSRDTANVSLHSGMRLQGRQASVGDEGEGEERQLA